MIVAGFGSVAGAVEPEAMPEYDSSQPIEIRAQQLEALQLQRTTIFSGDVVAVQGDITLRSDVLTIVLMEQENQINQMVAEGSVRVEQGDRVATAAKAVYTHGDETLTLTGAAQVVQGSNSVVGDEIIIYLREDRTLVKGSEQGRVKAVLTPGADE
jgi:lipopolysaccharide export system protein LptA